MPVSVSPHFFEVSKLGECQIKSPLINSPVHFHSDDEAILLDRDCTPTTKPFCLTATAPP